MKCRIIRFFHFHVGDPLIEEAASNAEAANLFMHARDDERDVVFAAFQMMENGTWKTKHWFSKGPNIEGL